MGHYQLLKNVSYSSPCWKHLCFCTGLSQCLCVSRLVALHGCKLRVPIYVFIHSADTTNRSDELSEVWKDAICTGGYENYTAGICTFKVSLCTEVCTFHAAETSLQLLCSYSH
jgi:hypothetical protein